MINDPSVIRSMIDSLGKSCRHELLAMHPGGPRPAFVLASARDSNSRMLERGVRIRTIYQHTARGDLATKSYVRDVTALGAEFRTADELVDRVLIYDRETVVLARHTGSEGTPTAAIVRESTLVGFVCKVFEYIWDGAQPFNPETAKAEAITDDLKQSVLRLMAKGYKDEMVARRLGMSVRTCRRHISEITEELEATSRFQAGFNVAMSGILDQFRDEF
ncbi:LuxR C-terminal-related transcriptional regulator [Kitasatospora gansuensis]